MSDVKGGNLNKVNILREFFNSPKFNLADYVKYVSVKSESLSDVYAMPVLNMCIEDDCPISKIREIKNSVISNCGSVSIEITYLETPSLEGVFMLWKR